MDISEILKVAVPGVIFILIIIIAMWVSFEKAKDRKERIEREYKRVIREEKKKK